MRLQLGCVHEHVYEADACAECCIALERGAVAVCSYCAHGPDPHTCRCEPISLASLEAS